MPGAESRWNLLRSEGLNVSAGLASALLLAIGSFVMAATHEGSSAGIEMDDIRVFLEHPSWVHTWFYLLIPTLSLWALNTLLCTWDTAWSRIRQRVWRPSAWASVLVHLSVLVALLAHLVGGLWSEELGAVVVTQEGADLPDGRHLTLEKLDMDVLPGGMPKAARASLTVREPDGSTHTEVVNYNEPLSAGFGRSLFLLMDQGQKAARARISTDAGRCAMAVGEPCKAGGYTLRLVQILEPGVMGPNPRARVQVETTAAEGPVRKEVWLNVESPRETLGLGGMILEGVTSSTWVSLRGRTAPGNPIAALSAVFMALGLLAMTRRLTGTERRPEPASGDASR